MQPFHSTSTHLHFDRIHTVIRAVRQKLLDQQLSYQLNVWSYLQFNSLAVHQYCLSNQFDGSRVETKDFYLTCFANLAKYASDWWNNYTISANFILEFADPEREAIPIPIQNASRW